MKVLVSDTISQEGLEIFRQQEGIELDYQPGLSAEELLPAIADAQALVLRGGTQVTEEVFAAAPKLRLVCRAGIGAANIDVEAATRYGVVVLNTPFGTTTTIAEHTISMLLATARMIPQASASVRSGEWDKELFQGVEVAGKTCGLIGAGKVGKLVITQAFNLGMRVIVNDPYVSEESIIAMGAEAVEFKDVLRLADFIILHLPLTSETANILNEETLFQVKPGCRIVNCAQGGLIDESALAVAISSGRVAGAALDVLHHEPPEKDNPLLALDQAILTPHIRASTADAQKNVAVQAAWQVVDYLMKGSIKNALNAPSISLDLMVGMAPYLTLAERLGIFAAQVCNDGVKSISVEYSGTVTEYPTEPMTLALLKGFLQPMAGDMVNFMNAAYLAQERGIRVVEARSHTPREGYANMIRLSVTTDSREHIVCGTRFGKDTIRIVQVDKFPVEAEPTGTILMLCNYDRPGVIAFVGKVLAEAGINIAMMNLSRRKIAEKAISLITLDSPAPDEVIAVIQDNENIVSAIQLSLSSTSDGSKKEEI